jgi:hypothetical protein
MRPKLDLMASTPRCRHPAMAANRPPPADASGRLRTPFVHLADRTQSTTGNQP